MQTKYYTARKLKPNGRDFWVIEFRHPLMNDSRGKKGKKIRRGLGTNNEIDAQEFIEQMNVLLSDERYWIPSGRQLAQDKFHPGIVNAFYDEIEFRIYDDEKTREKIIPLKTPKDGYSRVLLLGSTGAGKTTLLRQLMGTNPLTERFPATSTARTTVFDTEIILSEGNYKGIVTFFSEGETRQMIMDSIQNAMVECFNRNDDNHTLRVFLEDKDQRFRLSYLIGKIKDERKTSKYEQFSEDFEFAHPESKVSDAEQKEYELKIQDYLSRIKNITNNIIEKDREEYKSNNIATDEDKNLFEEIILTDILDYDGDDIAALVDEILYEIKQRFKEISKDGLVTEKFGWPIYWFHESSDRVDFLEKIRFFSSNSANLFGKLLTPLVSGMRIEGPFKPDFLTNIPRLIIYDGEGLGHIPNTTSNLPSKTIKKFDISDAIVLVDNSQSPMLASAYAVIKSAAISGHSQKLLLSFTHFDAVKGDNLPTIEDKENHIFGSVDGLLAKLETELDYEVKKFLITHLHNNTFYLGYLDEKLDKESKFKYTIFQLNELIKHLERIIPEMSSLAPNYDISTLIFKIRKAALEFHNRWEGHLFGNNTGIKQHFTRVKALTRRLGNNWETEYNDLRPISDFWGDFNGQISNFLSSPTSWNLPNPEEEEMQQSINNIKQKVGTKLFNYALRTIKNDKIAEWQAAFNFGGIGSATKRADKIESIYSVTVPVPEDEITPSSRQFLTEIMKIIKETIEENGGKVTSIFNS